MNKQSPQFLGISKLSCFMDISAVLQDHKTGRERIRCIRVGRRRVFSQEAVMQAIRICISKGEVNDG